MQEKSIEGHTPLYWTIVKRPVGAPIDPENATIGVIDLLLSFPLTQGTREDARQACLLNSDDELFQHLRRSPGFADISGSDDMLNLGETLPDKVQVRNEVGTQTGNFAVSIEIADFQRRMRITKRTRVEFIARGRIWSLDFYVNCVEPRGGSSSGTAKLGAWVVSVKLVGESPPTWLDSRVTIGALPSKDSRVVNPSPISIRLKTGREQMASDFYLPSWKRGWGTILETIEGGVEYE